MNKRKAELELVNAVMGRNDIDPRKRSKVIEDILVELENQVEDKAPPIKKEFVVIKTNDETAWAVQIPEEDSPHTVYEKILKAAFEFNQTPKGRRMPVKSVGEALEVVSARIFKEQNLWIKTKLPVVMISLSNQLGE